MNTAEYAHLRRRPVDELRVLSKHLDEMLASRGWEFLQNLLAAKQQAELVKVLAAPSGSESADTYALKRAHTAGYLRGLQAAYEAPLAVQHIAQDELEKAQRAAESEAHNQGDTP